MFDTAPLPRNSRDSFQAAVWGFFHPSSEERAQDGGQWGELAQARLLGKDNSLLSYLHRMPKRLQERLVFMATVSKVSTIVTAIYLTWSSICNSPN